MTRHGSDQYIADCQQCTDHCHDAGQYIIEYTDLRLGSSHYIADHQQGPDLHHGSGQYIADCQQYTDPVP